MIDVTDADALMKEIAAGEKERDCALRDYRRLLRQYVREMADSDWKEPLTAEYLSYMVGRICMDNPRVTVQDRKRMSKTVANAALQMIAQAVQTGQLLPDQAMELSQLIEKQSNQVNADQYALNCLGQDPTYGAVLDRVCYDHLMGFGVAHERIAPMPNDPSKRWPVTGRISPWRFCIDPTCLHHTEAQWLGHWRPETIDDLVTKAKADPGTGWKLDEIKSLTAENDPKADLDRKEVKVWETWVPGYTESGWPGSDEGYNGGFFTLAAKRSEKASEKGGIFIREPQPAFCPRWGPYSMFGVYVRPDSPYPMSPLLATYDSQDELQKHSKAMSLNAAQYKRIVLVSDSNPTLAQDIKSKGDHFVIRVKDEQFDKNKVVVIEIAGVSDQQLQHYEMFKARWDRAIGMDDQQRGKVNTKATATAVAVADSSASMRTSYIEKKFAAGVQLNMMNKLHYLRYDDRIEINLGPEYADDLLKATGQIIGQPTYVGGQQDEDDSIPDDLQVEVDLNTEPDTTVQQNTIQAMTLLFGIAPTMSQLPWMEWRSILQQIGDACNLPTFAESVNYDMIQGMAQMAMQNGTMPGTEMSPDGLARKQAETDQQGQRQGLADQHASKSSLMQQKHSLDMGKEKFKADTKMKQISAQAGARSRKK